LRDPFEDHGAIRFLLQITWYYINKVNN
jgi:hypothetical protein